MPYDAFLSYSQRDTKAVDWLQKQLESYPLKRLGIAGLPEHLRLFRDSTDLAGAGQLSETLRSALKECKKLIVICSPAAAQSKWVDLEIRTFLQTHSRDDVFAMYVAGQPYSRDDSTECVPPALRESAASGDDRDAEAYVVDATTPAKRRDGIVRIVAGLTGQPLDAFRNRHKRYVAAQRQALVLGGAALAFVLGAGAAASVELNRRDRLLSAAQNTSAGYERVRLIAEAAAPPGAILPELNGDRIRALLRHPITRIALSQPVAFVSSSNWPERATRFADDNAYAVVLADDGQHDYELLIYNTRHAQEPHRLRFPQAAGERLSFLDGQVYAAPLTRPSPRVLYQLSVRAARGAGMDSDTVACRYALVDAQGAMTNFERTPVRGSPPDGAFAQCPIYFLTPDGENLMSFPLVADATGRLGPDQSLLRVTRIDGELVQEISAADHGFAHFALTDGAPNAVLVDPNGRVARFDLTTMRIDGPVIPFQTRCQPAPETAGSPGTYCGSVTHWGRIVGIDFDRFYDLQTGRELERPPEGNWSNISSDSVTLNDDNVLRVGRLNDAGELEWREVNTSETEWRSNHVPDAGMLWLEPMEALRTFCSYDMIGVQAITPSGDFDRIERPCKRRGLLRIFG